MISKKIKIKRSDNISKRKQYNKHLKKGRFYLHSDTNQGHPALIIDKKDRKNEYKILCFTQTRDHYHQAMRKNIDPTKTNKCYVSRKPQIEKRKYLGSREWLGLRIHKDDKNLIQKIKRRQATIIDHKKNKR